MPFIVQNAINDYDPIHQQGPFPTQAEAETAAASALEKTPNSVFRIAQVLKVFRATVTVTAEDPTDPASAPEASAD